MKTVFDFDLSNPDSPDCEKIILKIVNTLLKTDTTASKTSSKMSPSSLVMKLNQHFQMISNCNSFQFGEFFHEKHADGQFYFDFTKVMGGGNFAFGSLFNHSCYPNVVHVVVEGKMIFIVARPIKAGEQIFVTYGPKYSTDEVVMRQARLQNYGFICDCIACANNYPRATGLQHKDQNFVAPKILTATSNAILQFRKNGANINKQSTLPASFERLWNRAGKFCTINKFDKLRLNFFFCNCSK